MKTYKFQIIADCGIQNIVCHTSAKTTNGVCRAMGVAVARTIGTDVFECRRKVIWMDGVAKSHSINAWHTWALDNTTEHMVWKAAQDAIMDGRLV